MKDKRIIVECAEFLAIYLVNHKTLKILWHATDKIEAFLGDEAKEKLIKIMED